HVTLYITMQSMYPSSILSTHTSPISTHFPYTTLFRSHSGNPWKQFFSGETHRVLKIAVVQRSWIHELTCKCCFPALARPYQGDKDRKSTRLNSSHVSISYAVFCLNKKRDQVFDG